MPGRRAVPAEPARGSSAYLWLSTRPVHQALAAVPADPVARERRRRQVVAATDPPHRSARPVVTLAAMGAVVPEALAAAERLEALGPGADVVCVTSPNAGVWGARRGR